MISLVYRIGTMPWSTGTSPEPENSVSNPASRSALLAISRLSRSTTLRTSGLVDSSSFSAGFRSLLSKNFVMSHLSLRAALGDVLSHHPLGSPTDAPPCTAAQANRTSLFVGRTRSLQKCLRPIASTCPTVALREPLGNIEMRRTLVEEGVDVLLQWITPDRPGHLFSRQRHDTHEKILRP